MATPTTTNDQYTLEQGATLTASAETGVLSNDTDAEAHPLSARILYTTSHGALSFKPDGTFTYKPYDPNFTGTDTFYYIATDGTLDAEPVAVTINVTPAETGGDGNAIPVAAADSFEMQNGEARGTVLGNDTDADGDALSASILYNPSYGSLSFNQDGSFVYTPFDTYAGSDEFFYTVSDGKGGTSQPVKVTISGQNTGGSTGGGDTGGNQGPDVNADSITLTAEADGTYTGSTVLANDVNVEGLAPSLVYNPGWGTVTLNADGTFSYVLADWANEANGFKGADEFYYKVNDSEVVKVTMTVPPRETGGETGGNAAPVAHADSYDNVALNGSRSFTSTVSLLANDTDANGDALTAVKQWNPGWGEVTVNPDGTFTYTLADWANEANGFKGADEFYYYAQDANGQSQLAKVTLNNIQTAPVVEEPPPADFGITVSHSGPDSVVGEDGTTDTISIVLKSKPTADVTVTVQEDTIAGVKADKTVTFTPDNWDVAQTVTLSATDNLMVDGTRAGSMYITASSLDEDYEGLIAAESFPVTVNDNDVEANEPPSAVWLNTEMSEDAQSVEVTPSASDWNGDQVTFSLVAQPEEGTVSYNETTKKFTFTPNAGAFDALNTGESKTVTFQYVANDGQLDSDPATVTIKVNGVTDVVAPPVLPVVSATTAPGQVNEGGVATFELSRTGDLTKALTVNIDTSFSGATPGTDFTAPTTVTFAANSATATLNIQTNKDSLFEEPETLEFRIAEGAGYTVGVADGNVTDLIDVPPVSNLPTVSISDASAQEGNQINFRINFSEPTKERLNITYEVVHNTSSGTEVPVGTTTIIANSGINFRGFNIQLAEDTIFEPNETFTVRVVSVKSIATGADVYAIADGEGTGTILNDDAAPSLPPGVSISKESLAVTEGGATDTFTVVLDAPPTADVSVQVSTGNELMALGPKGSSTLVFTAANWNVPQTITVKAEDDAVADGAMTDYVYFMTSSTDPNYNELLLDVMMPVAITDAAVENPMPYVTVANLGGDVAEGGEITFNLHRSEAGWDMPVVWSQGGAISQDDIQAIKWNGVEGGFEGFVGNSQTATVTFVLKDDTAIESTEDITFAVESDPTYMIDDPFSATGNVLDNDGVVEPPPPALTVSVEDVTVPEDIDGGQMVFMVRLSEPATQDVKVTYTIADGSAINDEDYANPGGGTIWFMAGEQERGITVPVYGDAVVEENETVNFTLTGVETGNATIVKGEATGTLTNDDVAAPILPEISVSTSNVTEGGVITYTFTRSGGSANAALDVAYTTGGSATAPDFTAPSGIVTFAAGSNTAIVTVQTTNDTADEADETVALTVQANAAAYTISQTAGTASATIIDNDDPVVTPPTNQTITAVTTTGVNFTGGEGNDTLIFPTIAAGGVQMLGGAGNTVVNADISLGKAIVGTIYNGKTISNIENLVLNDVKGPAGRTLTVNGDAKDNSITVNLTTKKTDINGGDGADTITYSGTGPDAQASVISGGTGNDTIKVTSVAIIDDRVTSGTSGNDTYDIGTSAKQEIRFGANNGNDTIKNYSLGDGVILPDVLDFATAGIDASTMKVAEVGGNTVFTINGGSTITVEGVTGLQFGTHWKALGTYTPPVEAPPPGGDEPTGDAGIKVSNLSLNVAEGGASDTTDVVLTRKPTSDVTVTLGSDGGVLFSVNGETPSATPTLTFTPENWNQPQTVTVTAIDDPDYENGDHGTTVYFEPIVTQDALYQEVFPPSGWATITDNDTEAAPVNEAPVASALSTDVWEDNPVAEIQGLGYDSGEFGITAYEIVSQPVEGGKVVMTDDRTFRFEGDETFLSSLNRGETKAVSFEYKVFDGEMWSAPEKITFNVHGITNGADETVQALETAKKPLGLSHNGGDGNDTLVFNSVTLTSGSNLEISLDKNIVWTNYGGLIENFENITIKNVVNSTVGRTLTVQGNEGANKLIVENTGSKLFLNGLGGDDTFDFTGTGTGQFAGTASIIKGGAGRDTVNANSGLFIDDQGSAGGLSGDDFYNFGAGVQEAKFYTGNGADTVTGFAKGVDKLHFLGGLSDASVIKTEAGGDTVFTINGTDKVTVAGVTGLTAGDWLFT